MIRSLAAATAILASPCLALDADDIKELAAKPHSRDGLLPELEIFPDAREFEVRVKSGKPDEELREAPETKAAMKCVGGKYFVTTAEPDGAPGPIIIVVTFDREAAVYRKWVLAPTGEVGESIGTGIEGTRSLSWVTGGQANANHSVQVLASESHGEEKTRWREIFIEDGEPVFVVMGEAKKLK